MGVGRANLVPGMCQAYSYADFGYCDQGLVVDRTELLHVSFGNPSWKKTSIVENETIGCSHFSPCILADAS